MLNLATMLQNYLIYNTELLDYFSGWSMSVDTFIKNGEALSEGNHLFLEIAELLQFCSLL